MSSSTPSNGLKPIMIASLVGLVLVVLFCNVGCYETGYQNGYIDPWYTSSIGLPAYPTLYDPTNDIQSVIGYSWEVMDWSNDAWSDYILQ